MAKKCLEHGMVESRETRVLYEKQRSNENELTSDFGNRRYLNQAKSEKKGLSDEIRHLSNLKTAILAKNVQIKEPGNGKSDTYCPVYKLHFLLL